jgi:general secretion pathway protein H
MSVIFAIVYFLQTNLQQFFFVVPRYARDNLQFFTGVGRRLRYKDVVYKTMQEHIVLPRQNAHKNHHKSSGFTLLEVMMVVMIVGIMASFVQFNVAGDSPEKQLKKASERFVAIFDAAAEYGLLNNIELGLYIKGNSYQFLGYDGVRWNDVPEQPLLAAHTLPEGIAISLSLDDLPIEEPLLFDANELIEQQKNAEEQANEASTDSQSKDKNSQQVDNTRNRQANHRVKNRIPQVYLLSGGDISAFSLTFFLNKEALAGLDIEPEDNIAYRVIGLYSTPLTVERVDAQGELLEQQ